MEACINIINMGKGFFLDCSRLYGKICCEPFYERVRNRCMFLELCRVGLF
jgi:hypothetical protein